MFFNMFFVFVLVVFCGCQTTKPSMVLTAKTLDKPLKAKSSEIIALASGSWHNCALSSAHKVYCWGNNDDGQLGHQNKAYAKKPTQVEGLPPIDAVFLKGYQSCAVTKKQGHVYCWGRVTRRRTGAKGVRPLRIKGLSEVREVAIGTHHICAITKQRHVYCWGGNSFEQLGVSGKDQVDPVRVPGVHNASNLVAGEQFNCAIVGVRVKCWGLGVHGQMGNGAQKNKNAPGWVSHLSQVHQLDAGPKHICARHGKGNIACWGDNQSNKLGHNQSSVGLVPVNLSIQAKTLGCGFEFCCATTSTNVMCWGSNQFDQLGNGTVLNAQHPTVVQYKSGDKIPSAPLGSMASLFVGHSHSCVHDRLGQTYCWGANHQGQLGKGNLKEVQHAESVIGLKHVTTYSTGINHTCALTRSHKVYCWGGNSNNQADQSDENTVSSPVLVLF